MAKRSVITLIDDIDGTEIGTGLGETVRFGIDGRSYEADLSNANASILREALRPFVDAARRVGPKPSRRRNR